MITMNDAQTAREFHHATQTQSTGCYRVRRNGRTQTWKTRPADFRIPVVHGLRGYGQITELDSASWHVADKCPRCVPGSA